MQALLDPSRLTLLVAHGAEADPLNPAVEQALGSLAARVELALPIGADARNAYGAALGRRSSVFLVCPDGYVGLAAGAHAAANKLANWRRRWFDAGPG